MQGRCLVQVKPEDGQLLNKQQAAKAEDQDLLRYFVTPPHHPGPETGGLGLVFMQKKQRRWGHGAFAFLDGGNGFITSSRRILQKGEETATGPAQKPQCPQSREVLERDGGRALS